MIYRAVAATCPGRKSEHNSNNFYLNSKYITEEYKSSEILLKQKKDQSGLQFYALAEGKGSDSYANEASLIAMKKLSNLHEQWKTQEIEGNVCDAIQGYIENYIDEANQAICARQPSGAQAKNVITTLAVLGINDKDVIACNLGNTRIYLFRKGTLTQLSYDHNQAQRMLELGLINQDQIEGNPKRRRLTQYLGPMPSNEQLDPNCVEIHTQQGDMFLLCSMTFCEVVSDGEIQKIFAESHSLSEIADKLMNQAGEKGLAKDTSIMVVRAVKDVVPVVPVVAPAAVVAGAAVVGAAVAGTAVAASENEVAANAADASSATQQEVTKVAGESVSDAVKEPEVATAAIVDESTKTDDVTVSAPKKPAAKPVATGNDANNGQNKRKSNENEKLWPALVIFGISLAIVIFLAILV